jgi:hypothetical protein
MLSVFAEGLDVHLKETSLKSKFSDIFSILLSGGSVVGKLGSLGKLVVGNAGSLNICFESQDKTWEAAIFFCY